MEAGISAECFVHGGDERWAERLLEALVPGEAVVVACVVVREFSRQMQADRERAFFSVSHSENVTLAGQLPGEGKVADLSVATKQSTSDSPASLGGVTPAAITEPSVLT